MKKTSDATEAQGTWAADLRALGVRISHPPRAGRAPAHEPALATTRSAPLVNILRRQNLDSLNLDAELLTKLLGAAVLLDL